MPPWLLEMLGLKPEATEEEIKAALKAKLDMIDPDSPAIQAAEAAAMNARSRIATLEGDLRTANQVAANARASHAKHLLDVAFNSGRITAAQRPELETAFTADFAAAALRLDGMKPAMNTQEIAIGDRKASIATAGERTAIINSAVSEVMTARGLDYSAAYNAVEKDPKFAAVFAAMQQPKGAK